MTLIDTDGHRSSSKVMKTEQMVIFQKLLKPTDVISVIEVETNKVTYDDTSVLAFDERSTSKKCYRCGDVCVQ